MNEENVQVAEATAAPETAPAAETAPAPEANKEAPAETVKSFDTALGSKAGEGSNGDTNTAQDGAQTADVVTYNFADTVKGFDAFEFSQENTDKFVDVIKDMNLNNDQANAIVKYGMEWANGLVQTVQQQVQAELDNMVQNWGESAKQQLGANYEPTLSKAASALEAVEKTVPGIRQALNETGAGNRVEIINALAFFADKIAGDPGMVAGASAVKNPADTMAARYPNTDWSKY